TRDGRLTEAAALLGEELEGPSPDGCVDVFDHPAGILLLLRTERLVGSKTSMHLTFTHTACSGRAESPPAACLLSPSLSREGMEDVDRIGHVQTLSQPSRRRGVCVQREPGRVVLRSDDLHGVVGYTRGRRDIGDHPVLRRPELQLALRPALNLESFL